MSVLFALFSAFYRVWLGGGIANDHRTGWDLTTARYLAGFFVPTAYVFWATGDVVLAVLMGISYMAFWRALGHGTMMTYPHLGQDDDDKILEYVLGGWWGQYENRSRWWLYSEIRYGGFGFIWACVVWVLTGTFAWQLLLAGAAIPFVYAGLYGIHPPLWLVNLMGGIMPGSEAHARTGDHDQYYSHYAEFVSGALVGAALVGVFG